MNSGYVCQKQDTLYAGNETHRCHFHPVQIPSQNFSSPELRAAFVKKQFALTCKNVEILSDTSFSGPEQKGVVLRRVGLRCEQ